MLRTIFGKKEDDENSGNMTSASAITGAEFKDALSRYPALIKKLSDAEKPAPVTLVQLDHYRYIDAPASFSKQTGRILELKDVQKLAEWKLRHGKWRPSLTKLVASNNDEKVAAATKVAFAHHASNPTDLTETLKILAAPLKGIGPATASLLLAVHDPKNVIFFSDEAYRWLVAGGEKTHLTYNAKEYDLLSGKAHALINKLRVTPIDVEKVAFVIIKENEPVYEPAPKKVPSGLPRGRPTKPDSEKKAKKPTVPGRGRGRPPTNGATKAKAAPAGAKKGRERPSAAKDEKDDEEEEEAKTPASKGGKRKAPDSEPASPNRSGKKAKA